MIPDDEAALILTAVLDDASQARFEAERQRHFPSARNFIAAHVTLFHHLPGRHQALIGQDLAAASQSQAQARCAVTGWRARGRGTAYVLDMPEVAVLRHRLAAMWRPWLTAQDRQGWRPHVTIQNKVPPDQAKRLHATLLAAFAPGCGTVTGLALWRYIGGPWEALDQYGFAGKGQTMYHRNLNDAERDSSA